MGIEDTPRKQPSGERQQFLELQQPLEVQQLMGLQMLSEFQQPLELQLYESRTARESLKSIDVSGIENGVRRLSEQSLTLLAHLEQGFGGRQLHPCRRRTAC
jgi:hypothetical protein